ncbi:hypothetical protein [Ohtaekwangia sp.]
MTKSNTAAASSYFKNIEQGTPINEWRSKTLSTFTLLAAHN